MFAHAVKQINQILPSVKMRSLIDHTPITCSCKDLAPQYETSLFSRLWIWSLQYCCHSVIGTIFTVVNKRLWYNVIWPIWIDFEGKKPVKHLSWISKNSTLCNSMVNANAFLESDLTTLCRLIGNFVSLLFHSIEHDLFLFYIFQPTSCCQAGMFKLCLIQVS